MADLDSCTDEFGVSDAFPLSSERIEERQETYELDHEGTVHSEFFGSKPRALSVRATRA